MIDEEIQKYAEKYTSAENELLTALLQKTYAEREDRQMISGFYQGRLLAMLSKMVQPRRILEIGTFTGYSALCLAEGLTEDGKLITLDTNASTTETAREFWAQTQFYSKIESYLGDALEIIPVLNETFDLVFIDADKPSYIDYYEAVFPKVRIGGIIIADNILRGGRVLKAEKADDDSVAPHDFNKKIQADGRVSNIILTVRDGLTVIIKERE